MPKIRVKGQTVQTGECPQTNRQTHTNTDATKRIIAPATRLISMLFCCLCDEEVWLLRGIRTVCRSLQI